MLGVVALIYLWTTGVLTSPSLSLENQELYCGKHCLSGCNETSGYCEICNIGWYGPLCLKQCGPNCEYCNKTTGACQECKRNWYSSTCDKQCEEHCVSCNMKTGKCERCREPLWGPKCDKRCIENCQTCDFSTGFCTECVGGYYGENCTKRCGHCKKNECGRVSGECVFECEAEWYGARCDQRCLPRCSVCTDSLTCHACEHGVTGLTCDTPCPSHCKDCTTNQATKELICTECSEHLKIPSMNCSCSHVHCLQMEVKLGEEMCTECMNGTFQHLGTCCPCVHCDGGISNCDSNTGCTKGCEKGYYPPETGCNKFCDIDFCSNCAESDGTKPICEECQLGHYVDKYTCKICSENCLEGHMCDNRTGVCPQGCEPGWNNMRCDSRCDDHCLKCDNDLGECLVCELGYWGKKCKKCLSNCDVCDQITGECILCIPGYYGPNCYKPCENCYKEKCIEGTFDCSDGCKPGFYGESCTDHCFLNCDHCMDSETCIKCSDNRLGEHCELSCPSTCKECSLNFLTDQVQCDVCKEPWKIAPKHCKCSNLHCKTFDPANSDNKTCSVCQSRWFLFKGTCCPCEECEEDKERCFVIGQCPDECSPSYVTEASQCSTMCKSYRCSWCRYKKNNEEHCQGCESGYYPVNGKCKQCPQNCAGDKNKCDVTSGRCLHRCKTGWFGEKCETMCPVSCAVCNEERGHCVQCKDGYYGDDCTRECTPTCLRCQNTDKNCSELEVEESTVCNRTSGDCLHGCDAGYFDEKCETRCKRCKGGLCDRDTGVCTAGCVKGWKGKSCNILEDSDELPRVEAIVGGAVGGALFIVIVIVLGVCFIRRHQVPKKVLPVHNNHRDHHDHQTHTSAL